MTAEPDPDASCRHETNPEEPIANISLDSKEEDIGESRESKKNGNQSSPQGVFEIPVRSTNHSHDSNSSIAAKNCDDQKMPTYNALPDGLPRSLHWKDLITTLLHRRTGKSVKGLLTFPSFSTTRSDNTKNNKKKDMKKSLRRRLTAGNINTTSVQVNHQDERALVVPTGWKPSWRNFDYGELAAATDNFSSERVIGKGGHAVVYRGRLDDGQLVAIKRLSMMKNSEEERIGGFLSELGMIAHVNHPNAACLVGFGVDGGLHLILKLSTNGSLASRLHAAGSCKEEEKLTWRCRYKIALGVAQGLLYLHEGCYRRIIHRDIKTSNILLTDEYQPQISDFGLAKWLPEQSTHHQVFPIEGTFGYMAPEFFMHGVVSEKTDVFAFGVMLLELLTGRHAVDSCRQSLVMWAKPFLDSKELKGLVDPRLQDEYDEEEMKRLVSVAKMCIHHISIVRPVMSKVVKLLEGEEGEEEEEEDFTSLPLFDARHDMEQDYTPSTYLNDINRHNQLVLEH